VEGNETMNKIFECTFGSKLFGCALPTSDDDRKGIFIENMDAIILNRARETIKEENKETGVDFEFKELRRFIFDCMKGQTYALELLFAPESFWHRDGWSNYFIWKDIVANREKLLSRSVTPFIGFAMGQAQKYSLKGSKYNDLTTIIMLIKECNEIFKGVFSKSNLEFTVRVRNDIGTHKLYGELLECKSIQFEKDNHDLNMTNFLGKKFYDNVSCKEVLKTLQAFKDRYGDRATKAAAEGEVDTKAYYHSVRLLDEVIELTDTGVITLSRPNAQHLLDIRNGKFTFDELVEEVDEKAQIAREKIDNSSLPEKVDEAFWNKFLLKFYRSEARDWSEV
jgi:hypothetical protein